MKKFSLKVLLVTLSINILDTTQVFASRRPPMPRGSGDFDYEYVVGADIDSHIIFLFIFSVIFGVWMKVKRNEKLITIK